MTVLQDLSVLDQYSVSGFVGWPADKRAFFSPVDDVHSVLLTCLSAAQESLAIAMYGFDDEDLANALEQKMTAEHVTVQLTLDSSQAGGVHERNILTHDAFPSTVIAVGRSEKGAIMHQKIMVVDGILTISGSTNWSLAGEQKQDNELEVHLDSRWATRYRARCDAIHAYMLSK